MVWGPGTFGYSPMQAIAQPFGPLSVPPFFGWVRTFRLPQHAPMMRAQLRLFKLEQGVDINLDKIHFDTEHHGESGGDNFMEGSLDVRMISSFGLNATTLVSNTNTSTSTEEGEGFGLAMLDFLSQLASRPVVPHVLSLSLGSLSPYSCNKLCDEVRGLARGRGAPPSLLLQPRCEIQAEPIAVPACHRRSSTAPSRSPSAAPTSRRSGSLQALGLRGVTVVGSSGDGGSHWSFEPFEGFGKIASALNEVGCEFQFPIYPSPSPYMLSIGGTSWEGGDATRPIAWSGSGGGFSWQFPAPAHQSAVVGDYLAKTAGLPPASSYNASGRAYPDVSAVATEGTSESAPTMGGIFTL
eukprot:6883971-Prymnesium_polylepis.1